MVTIIRRDNDTSSVISKSVLSKEDFEIWLNAVLQDYHRITNISDSIIFIEFTDTHATCFIE